MKLIAAVDKNWAIGKDGRLFVHIPEDMKFFREDTAGKVVIMGRKTLESLKNRMPLPGRVNIVLTKNLSCQIPGALVCHSIEEAVAAAAPYAQEDVFVIGGGSIYSQMLDYCDEAHITKVDYAYDGDTYFPNLDQHKDWHLAASSGEKTYFDIVYEFVKYVRVR